MALEPNPITGKISTDQIARSLIVSADPAAQEADDNQEVLETARTDADDVQELDPGDGTELVVEGELDDDAGAEGEDSLEAAEADGDATDEEENDEQDSDFDVLELADDTIIPVTVDGEEKEFTLAQLRNFASGEGAIDKRIQEAAELRNTAQSERDQVQKELDTGRQNLVKAFETFDQLMFQPTVPKPDASLQTTNPQKYVLQSEAYRTEQDELARKRQSVQSTLTAYRQQEEAKNQRLRQENAAKLVELVPDLKEPEKAREIETDLLAVMRQHGFSEQEIAEKYDYREFQIAMKAAAYDKLMAGQQAQPKLEGGKPKTRKKVLRPKASPAVQRSTAYAREMKAKISRARETGKAEDIAQTLIVRKPRR